MSADLPGGSHQFDRPRIFVGEGSHREGDRDAACKLDGDDLMVDDIVVGMIDAPAVRSGFQSLQHPVIGHIVGNRQPHPIGSVGIDLRRVIGTCRLGGATVHAVVRGSLWGVLRFEIGETSKRSDLPRARIGEPNQQIQIMTGFGEDHRACLAGIAPVAADITMGLMPIGHIFIMLNGDQFADSSGIDQVFYRRKEWCIP